MNVSYHINWLLLLFFAGDASTQEVAMCDLAGSTDAASVGLEGWLCANSHPKYYECTWQGVECSVDGSVTSIDLSSQNINGFLPTSIGMHTV